MISEALQTEASALAVVRRDLHAHPELGFQEERTSSIVASKLEEWGIPVHRGLGKTGVIGVIKGRAPGPGIGLRADMDALPMPEANTFAHASRHPGKMHACGHDGHTTMLLAAAQQLIRQRNFDGTVYLIFQPAEEGGGGAREMIKEGLFDRFPMEAVFALHNWPGGRVGTMAASPGPVLASTNDFKIVIKGRGAHAAMPNMGVDPVVAGAQLVTGFQSIISRNKKPIDAAVISVTMIHAGSAVNVIPDSCELQGTVRTFSLEVLDLVERRMREMAAGVAAGFGCEVDFHMHRNYPPTINHAREVEIAKRAMEAVVGAENVGPQEPTMGAEDFAFMLLEKPGCYGFIFNGEGAHRDTGHGAGPCVLHNGSYDFNDALLPLGAAYWVKLVQTYFQST